MTSLNYELEVIQALWGRNQLPEALARCRALATRYPDSAIAWSTGCAIALEQGAILEALGMVERALGLRPDNRALLLRRARCLQMLGRPLEARTLALDLANQPFSTGSEYGMLAGLLAEHGRHELALAAYRKASALDQTNSDLHYNMATVQRFLGDLEGAEASCTAALRLRPNDPDALSLRSGLRTWTAGSNHIDELLTALRCTLDPRLFSKLSYALAKEYEDLGQYSSAFSAMQQAGAARRKTITYDVAVDEKILESIAVAYPCERFKHSKVGHNDGSAIFVVGLPRSGTTLVERMLSASDHAQSAGELPTFPSVLSKLVRETIPSPTPDALTLVERSTSIDFAVLGRRYVETVRRHHGAQDRFVDKLPLNFLYVGLIHRALPNAKVVHVTRGPLDVCLAIYKQHFEVLYPFSYDLNELARYYVAYHKLMAHWHRVLPGSFFTVSYEGLVADPEGVSRQMLSYCGIEWQPSCVDIASRREAVTTASAVQVREPIHARSVGRWRSYAVQLRELREHLVKAGIECST
jgi:tetratricopeptide (TPR) repeat protein